MPSWRTQFHALPHEIASLLTQHAPADCHFVGLTFPPFGCRSLLRSEVAEALADARLDGVAITLALPDLKSATRTALLDGQSGCVLIDVGHLQERGLGESAMSLMGTTEQGVAPLKPLLAALKKLTRAGAWAIDPGSGAGGPVRTHRYSAGAAELAKTGVAMLSLGRQVYRFNS